MGLSSVAKYEVGVLGGGLVFEGSGFNSLPLYLLGSHGCTDCTSVYLVIIQHLLRTRYYE